MDDKVKGIVAELRGRLEALYGERLATMVLYGSYARGDAEPGSDIDVLVVLKGDVSPGEEIARTSETVAKLSLEHDVLVSRAFVSEERYAKGKSPFIRNVRREGVVV